MAEVTPDDVALVTWRDQDPSAISLLQPGAPGLTGHAALAGAANLTAPGINALAKVTVRGTPGENVELWRFGFIQLKFITDEWAHYRGTTAADGSIFQAMDRPPARLQQLCRDSAGIIGPFERFPFLGPAIFYAPETPMTGFFLAVQSTGFLPLGAKIPDGGTMILVITFYDSPARFFAYELTKVNKTAQNLNFLYSLYSGAAYATMFAVQKGPGLPIVVMKSFQWNVRWRAHFGMNAGRSVQLPPRPGDVLDMNISHVVNGPPNDPRFRHAILDTKLPNCLNVIDHAFANPVIRESTKWEDWNVSH